MTVPYYGKREAGSLTAAAPGDTLYFQFGTYNDSGDSEALTGFAVTDIEVFKNGAATARATDSGYSLISDTGQIGDRVGLYRCSIQLFNTADDATFYASGAWYQAAVDVVTIDGKNVRFWLGSWEIGRQKVNAVEIDSDTGAADQLQKAFASGFADTGINDNLGRIRSDVDTGIRAQISDVDTGLHDHINDIDTGLRDHVDNTDTGLRAHIDDLDTGIKQRFNALAEDTGGVSVNAIFGDTGAAQRLSIAFVNGFTDTGLNERLARIQSDVDTGIRVHIDDSDTGVKDAIADLDTGLRGILNTTGVNVTSIDGDTGSADQLGKAFTTTPTYFQQVNVTQIISDTGGADRLGQFARDRLSGVGQIEVGTTSTASPPYANVTQLDTDTGAANQLRAAFADGFADTGINDRLSRIGFDADTGLRDHINDLDTGLRDHVDNTDTGLRAFIDDIDTGLKDTLADYDTGLRDYIDNTDTGLRARINTLAEDTGGVNVNAIFGDTGAANQLKNAFADGLNDTGLNDRLARILADTDTGIQGGVTVTAISDTGINNRLTTIENDTGAAAKLDAIKTKTDSLTFTVAGHVDSNVQSVNDVTVTGTGASGSEWGP